MKTIDRDLLIRKYIDTDIAKFNNSDVKIVLENLKQNILKMPSADRPRGEWIFKTVFPNDKSEFPMGYLVCSVCGSHHSNSTPCNYCDNCGARMKGADDD